MPENETREMQSSETSAPTETALERFERERMTRRQALKKFGITSAMTTFAMFSVDDLARMVGKAMQQKARDNKVAGQIAKEFQQAGIAVAARSVAAPNALPAGNCNNFQNGGGVTACDACNQDRHNRCIQSCPGSIGKAQCASAFNCGSYACNGTGTPSYAALQQCWSSVCASCLANCN